MSVRITLCADDYGISPSVDIAIRDLIVRGRLNATSVMVVTPSFGRTEVTALAALNSAAPRVSIGLHLTLTAPFRPLSQRFAPLVGGAFPTIGTMLRLAVLHRFARAVLEAEIASQLQAFRDAFGRPPDFVDGHQHVHVFPQIGEALLAVVREHAPQAWVRQCGRVLPLAARFADRKGLLLDLLSYRFRHRAARLGVRTNPAFAGTYAFTAAADFAALFPRFLDGLSDGSLVMCHPGFVDKELQRLDPLTTLREKEYAYLAGDAFQGTLAAHGVAL
jgi:chitin disaccharide deacetylase